MFDTSVVFRRILRLNEAVSTASSSEDRARCRSDLDSLYDYLMAYKQDIIDLSDGVAYLGKTLFFVSNAGFSLDSTEGRFVNYKQGKIR